MSAGLWHLGILRLGFCVFGATARFCLDRRSRSGAPPGIVALCTLARVRLSESYLGDLEGKFMALPDVLFVTRKEAPEA